MITMNNNTGNSQYFKRSNQLIELMLDQGICQYFFTDNSPAHNSIAKNLQELFVKGLTLYFTLTGKTDTENLINYDIYLRQVTQKVKEVMTS